MHLFGLFECMIMHGITKPKKVWEIFIMEHYIREMFTCRQKQVQKTWQSDTITFIPH
jgi:hypothetical protein